MSTLSSQLVRRMNADLERAYGAPDRIRPMAPLDSLVLTILSQNTNDRNSDEGFRRLRKRFRTWRQVAEAPVSQIASAIKVAGLSNTKAPRIKQILERVRQEQGRYSLDFLRDMDLAEAREYLARFDGVGPKTAACVLLFSCGKPVFPVDTHILRIAKRLGLMDRRITAEEAHCILGKAVPAEIVYSFHVLLIHHGRETCRATDPLCGRCVLRRGCRYYRGNTGQESSGKRLSHDTRTLP